MQILENVQDKLATSAPPPILRTYQKQFISDFYSLVRCGEKRILGFAPTGAGKTLLASQIAVHATTKGKRTMIIVHRDILVSQTSDKLSLFGLNDCGFIKSGWQENRDALVQIASVQTLVKRDWWHNFPADVVLIDECHITAFSSIVQQMMATIYPEAIYLGLTATPFRLKKRESLGDIFQSFVSAPMPHQLIDAGFLIKPAYFPVTEADMERVGTTVGGDFDEAQLALACDQPELVQQIVKDWKRLATDRRTIAFAVNVLHAKHLFEAFSAAGIPAAYVSGSTPLKQTYQIYQQLASGEIKVLASCMKIVEGFDVPAVSAALLCRPTNSPALHFQMIGRVLRLSPETAKVDAVIIDQAGNLTRHGFVEDIKSIILEPGAEPVENDAPKKVCPIDQGGCGAMLYAFQMKCSNCGYLFEKPKKVYLIPEIEEFIREEDLERFEFYRQKLREAYEKNLDPGWAAHSVRERFGHFPPDPWGRGAVFGNSAIPLQQMSYRNYLSALARRKEKPESWVERYMTLEFGFEQVAQIF